MSHPSVLGHPHLNAAPFPWALLFLPRSEGEGICRSSTTCHGLQYVMAGGAGGYLPSRLGQEAAASFTQAMKLQSLHQSRRFVLWQVLRVVPAADCCLLRQAGLTEGAPFPLTGSSSPFLLLSLQRNFRLNRWGRVCPMQGFLELQ